LGVGRTPAVAITVLEKRAEVIMVLISIYWGVTMHVSDALVLEVVE